MVARRKALGLCSVEVANEAFLCSVEVAGVVGPRKIGQTHPEGKARSEKAKEGNETNSVEEISRWNYLPIPGRESS